MGEYVKRDTCAGVVAKAIYEGGATIDQMIKVAEDFHERTGDKRPWGTKKGDIKSHVRWLRTKGVDIQEKDGVYTVAS